MVIDNKFELGQIVYVVTDTEQLPRQVTEIQVKPGGTIVYELSCSVNTSVHYDFELSTEVDLSLKTN